MAQVGNRLELGPERIEALTDAALDAFSARLKVAAAAGGTLVAGDIDGLAARFRSEAGPQIKDAVRRTWESCVNDPPRALFEEPRHCPFQRIVVQQFAHLLVLDDAAPAASGQLSRHIIPGFLRVLDMMIGPEPFEVYESRGAAIVDRLRQQHGDRFTWSDFHRDPEARELANDVLVEITVHFIDLERRKRWLIGVIDRHLPEPLDGNGAAEATALRFGAAEVQALMQALYADLRRHFADPSARARLVERYGDAAAARLGRLFQALDQADAGTA
jgi:hypothetical protein